MFQVSVKPKFKSVCDCPEALFFLVEKRDFWDPRLTLLCLAFLFLLLLFVSIFLIRVPYANAKKARHGLSWLKNLMVNCV